MKKRVIIIVALLVIAAVASIYPIMKVYYNTHYTEELQELLSKDIKDYKYANSVSVKDMMKKERYIILEMSSDFNSLTREEKHGYLQNDLGEKLQHTYSAWVRDNDIYDNKLWETADLTFLDIAIVINCDDKTYKYGYYTKKKYFDFVEEFVDSDGKNYKFVNEEEKNKYYDSLKNSTKSTESSSSGSSYTGSYDATLEYGSGRVLICSSKTAMDRYMTALNNHSQGTIDEMEKSGEVAWTAKGTKCNIVESGIGTYKVKLLDGVYAGNTVYVISESVKKK